MKPECPAFKVILSSFYWNIYIYSELVDLKRKLFPL